MNTNEAVRTTHRHVDGRSTMHGPIPTTQHEVGNAPIGEPGSGFVRGSLHTVRVYRSADWRRRRHAECSCGWAAPQPFIRANATVDALSHAAATGHRSGWPLIVDGRPALAAAWAPS